MYSKIKQQSPNQNFMMPGFPQMGMQPVSPLPMYPGIPQLPQNGRLPTTRPDLGFEEGPPTTRDIGYTPAFLKTQIGRRVKFEFLIGTNMFVDREGTLLAVGVNYVIIQESETDDLLLCDLYSIKFAKFYY